MKIKGFFVRNKLVLGAFLLPVTLVILAFSITGIYPFGDNQIAVIDMYHQYVPFLSELQYKLQEGGSLFYTWNGAGGSNFWNLMAYYGASPLNLLLALFPKKFIMEGVTAILLIKIGLSGSFMAIYLKALDKTRDAAVIAFATFYALNSYVMAYYWCIMWMDAVMLLPLCILGLNRLMDQGKACMYTVSLALIVFCNYYIAIMVCIFILFYYPVMYFTKWKWNGIRQCALVTGKAVAFSLLAIAMAAVMLLPTYISMQETYYISADMPENILFYNDMLDIINQLLPYSELTFREGLPNIYCGMLTVLLLVFYMMSRSINIREKLVKSVFLVFMLLSLNINKLDFIWHGFHFPNQLPYRYTFVICFVLITMAYKAFRRFNEVTPKAIWILLLSGTVYYLIAQKLLTQHIDDMTLFFYGGMAWLILYCVVMLLYKKTVIQKSAFVLLVLVLAAAEMASGVCTAFNTVGNTQKAAYFENYSNMAALAEKTKDEFVRTEADDNYILNCPAFYHYRGISQFSSSVNANTTALMEKIGIEGEPGKNRFNYNQTNPVTNAMLNIKYMISKAEPVKDEDFLQVAAEGNSRLYESRYPLSIGYMTDETIRTWDTHSENPFDVLDSYVRAATGHMYDRVFIPAAAPVIEANNMQVSQKADGRVETELSDQEQEAVVRLRYKAEKTQKYYVFVEAAGAREIIVGTGDEKKPNHELEIRNDCGSVINIGEIDAGKTFDIIITFDKGEAGDITSHVCSLDYSLWDKAYSVISGSPMTITDSGDGYIRGTVNAEDGGMLVTSVPYEKGWTMKVDGHKREISELTGGVFISAALDSGIHEVELSFRPPGIVAGLIITLCSILILTAYSLIRKKHMHIRPKPAMYLSASQGDEVSLQEGSDDSRI